MKVSLSLTTPLPDSFRVQQVLARFGDQVRDKCTVNFDVECPGPEEDFRIGLIVGSSGSGKTSTARHVYGDSFVERYEWPRDKAVIDCIGPDQTTEIVVQCLNAVGLGSPPAWIKPYHVLSNGERARCDLARGLLSGMAVLALDELTSLVGRTVARTMCEAVRHAIEKGWIKSKLVGITCHEDVIPWLQPDWVLDMASKRLVWGSVRRCEPIQLAIFRCDRSAWSLFAPHHYLDERIHVGAQCYLAEWDERPVAFVAMLHVMGFKNRVNVSRVVTLPDYQGIGIGSRVMEAVCELVQREGKQVRIVASHPAIHAHCKRSPRWALRNVEIDGNRPQNKAKRVGQKRRASTGRAIASFEFIG